MFKPLVFSVVLFAAAVAVRVLYVLALQSHPAFDAPMMDAAYHYDWARALAEGEEFQDGPFFRAPLYPILLACLVKGLGATSIAGTLGLRLAQSAIGGLTAVLTYRLGARAFGGAVGGLAGVLVASSWVLVAFDAELLIPVLFIPLLLVALERLLWWNFEDAPKKAFWVGLAFGLAAIARPNILALMPVLFAWTLWSARSGRGTAGRGTAGRPEGVAGKAAGDQAGSAQGLPWGTALALTFGTLIPIAPITVHNFREGDTALIATQAGVNLWIGNNPSSDGATAIVPGTPDGWWEGYYGAVALAERSEGRELRPSEVSGHFLARAFGWMATHPADAASGFLNKLRLLLGAEEIANNQDIEFTAMRTLPWLRWSPARWDVLLGLGVVGFLLASRTRAGGASRPAKTLLLYLIVYGATIVLFFVNARFRTPLIPVMAVGAAYGLVGAVRAARAGNVVRLALIVGPALAIGAASHWVTPGSVARSDAVGLMDLGQAELRRGNHAAALAHLEAAHRLSPSHPQVCFQLASALNQAGADPRKAIGILDGALRAPGAFAAADIVPLRLELRLKLGEGPAVLVEAERLLGNAPAHSKLRFVRGAALVQANRIPEAIAAFQGQARDEPMNAEPLYVLGQIFQSRGQNAEARSAYQSALNRARSMAPMVREDIARRMSALR